MLPAKQHFNFSTTGSEKYWKTAKNDKWAESKRLYHYWSGAGIKGTSWHSTAVPPSVVIKNNWPNDKATHFTAISSPAVVAVIRKKLGSEEKVSLPNRKEADFKLNSETLKI